MFKLLATFLSISLTSASVVVSSGLGNWNYAQMWQEFTSLRAYTAMGLIDTGSMLVYSLEMNGTLGVYDTIPEWSAEQFQADVKRDMGLIAIPTLYCDATIGNCANLSARIEAMIARAPAFIEESIVIATRWGWDGYSVDFEPDGIVDPSSLTTFMIQWATSLNSNNLTLNVWIGGNAPYDNRILNSSYISITTMDTYGSSSLAKFVGIAGPLQTSSTNISLVGFGLLTNYGSTLKKMKPLTDNVVSDIFNWCLTAKCGSISLWASHIDPMWYSLLSQYRQHS